MNSLELVLFGHPQVFVDGGEAASFNTRKDFALLVYLAVTGAVHSREHLAGLLWCDLPEAKAQRNLRHALSHLRKVIGTTWIDSGDGVALTRQLPWCVDVQTLRTAVDTFASTVNGKRDRQAAANVYQALQLYRGEFLQGFYLKNAELFEEWVVAQRAESHLLVLRGLELVAQSALAQGDDAEGLTATRRLLQLEPWSEAGHRLLMKLLAQSGQRNAALLQYEQCRQILAAELGVEPMPETTALYTDIQNGKYDGQNAHRQAVLPFTKLQASPSANAQHTHKPDKPTVPNNLFVPLAGFVGRQAELEFIHHRLVAPDYRLLTIVGPGGMGKSSLAIATGQQLLAAAQTDFPDGIFWIPLADITRSGQRRIGQGVAEDATAGEAILRAIADQLSTQLAIRLSSTAQLHAYLRSRRLLLILDNFEHLLAGSHALITLLTQAAHVKVLVTSRARLNVRGETVLSLEKLSLPGAIYQTAVKTCQANAINAILDDIQRESEAIAMFIRRARQLDPAFAIDVATLRSIAQICQLVDGLPLGIELATSMLPLLRCDELATELAESLDFLETNIRDLPQDQRTLAAVFERSWCLLSAEGQQLLARLSIFPGSFGRAAAEVIAGASLATLKYLFDQSLVSKIGQDRYLLHRTIHAFARQKLQQWPAQIATLHTAYAHFYLNLLADQEQWMTGSAYGKATERIRADLHNIHTAWYRAVAHEMDRALNNCLTALMLFYDQQGFYLDAFALYSHALSHCELRDKKEPISTESISLLNLLLGRLQTLVGFCNIRLGQLQQAQHAYQASWSHLQQQDKPDAAALCCSLWGASLRGSDPQRSVMLLTEAQRLAQASHLTWLQAITAQALGETNFLFGNYAIAKAQITEGYAVAKQIAWPRGLTSGHKGLGLVNLLLGDYRQAEEQFKSAIVIAHQHHHQMLYLESTLLLGASFRLQERFDEANSCFVESRKIAEELGGGVLIVPLFWEEGCLAEHSGDYLTAKARFTESVTIGLPNWWSHALPTLGWALIGLGEVAEAQSYFQTVLADAEAKGRLPISLDAQAGLAYIAALQASTRQRSSKTMEKFATVLQTVYHHPAATQETRHRVAKLAREWGASLKDALLLPIATVYAQRIKQEQLLQANPQK